MFELSRFSFSFAMGCVMFVMLSFSTLATANHADDYPSQEVAELILGIIHFSRWPDSKKDLQLCIVGETKHADLLLNTDLTVGDYHIDSQWIDDAQLLEYVSLCQVIFFGHYNVRQINDFYAQLYGMPVLTIDEWNEDCRIGGMFCLHNNQGRLGFKVNLDAVGRSQVRVQPNVLRLGQHRANK